MTWQMPGLGPNKCRAVTKPGRCSGQEIDGLEYCLHHVPDDLLEEAEEITGVKRCRHHFGQPDACRQYAVKNTVPPQCKNHGANQGGSSWKNAQARTVEGKITDRFQEIMSEQGARMLAPTAIGDPLAELLDLAAEMGEFRLIMREQTAELITQSKLRYSNAKVGEQLRVEALLYERALERFAKILIDISKLNIEGRMQGIREEQLRMLEQALDKALESSGVGLDGIMQARQTFRANVRVIAGELAG